MWCRAVTILSLLLLLSGACGEPQTGPEEEALPSNPFTPSDEAAVMAGAELVTRNGCPHCHADADGGLSGIPLHDIATRDERFLFDTISRGVSGTIMPTFGDSLTDRQIWQVITYLQATYPR